MRPLACAVAALLALPSGASADDATFGEGADVVVTVRTEDVVRKVPPGAVGWGAMWKRGMLWPAPPPESMTDAQHAAYLRKLADTLKPLIEASDTRHLSWPWGVSFSTWGVNWENSAGKWSERTPDRARMLLGPSSGWNETAVVGVGDLLFLAKEWELEAVTVSVPLMVFDGHKQLWGAHPITKTFDDAAIEKVADHAVRLVAYMRKQPAWSTLQRVYLSAGCEWRHYSLKNPSNEVLSYAKLVRAIRERIDDQKVVVVASASDSADIRGIEELKAATWNKYLHEKLQGLEGVALDLHRYRGMIGLSPDAPRRDDGRECRRPAAHRRDAARVPRRGPEAVAEQRRAAAERAPRERDPRP